MADDDPHAVVAMALFPLPVLERLAEIRRAHDPHAERIAPHFTIVYPTRSVDEATLRERVITTAASAKPFEMKIRTASVVRASGHAYVFLLPDEAGHNAITALHRGVAPRPADDYLPHVTIARDPDLRRVQKAADAWHSFATVAARARISALTLIRVPQSGPVVSLLEAPLAGG